MQKYNGYLQLLLVTAFVAVSVLISVWIGQPPETILENGGGETTFYVDVQEVASAPHQVSFTTTGLVQSRSKVQIIPQVSGRIVDVKSEFSSGTEFEPQEALFRIDPEDFQYEIRRLEAEVARATTALEVEKVESSIARAEWAQQNGTKLAPALAAREPQLNEAKANLQAAEANLANAELRLKRTTFRLPEAGQVISSQIAVGQYVQAGVGYGEVFYFDSLEVSSSLNGKELDWLYQTRNPEVEFRARHLGRELKYQGQLNRGAAVLDSSTRFAGVHFGFQEKPEDLIPGVFVEITVKGPTFENASLLPISAMQQDGRVWILDEAERLQPINPEIIQRTPDWIAVLNMGEAASVVTSRLHGATPGSKAITKTQATQPMAQTRPNDSHAF